MSLSSLRKSRRAIEQAELRGGGKRLVGARRAWNQRLAAAIRRAERLAGGGKHVQARRDLNRRLRRLRAGDDDARETPFLRRDGETYRIVKTDLRTIYGDEVDNMRDMPMGIPLTGRPEFNNLRWGDILYDEDLENSRERAYHAIVVNDAGERFALSISGDTGSGVDIPTAVTSRIENPMTFYDKLEETHFHPFEGELFVMLDSRAHYDAIYEWSGMPNIALHTFFWNGSSLMAMPETKGVRFPETEVELIDGDYGNVYVKKRK